MMDQMTTTETDLVPSPFLPDTHIQYAWDSTSLGALKTCPRLYQYTMIEGWVPSTDAIHLRFGIEYHQALHDYEVSKANGVKHLDAVHDTVRALLNRIYEWNPEPRTDTEKLKSKPNLLRTVIWYLEKFKDDPCKTTIRSDGSPAMEVSFKFELDWGPQQGVEPWIKEKNGEVHPSTQPYLLCGHLDRVVEYAGANFVMDRKTTTSTPSEYYFKQFSPNNQMTLYSFAGQIVLQSPIKGVIIDAAQVVVGFSHFVRDFTYRTEDQTKEWLADLKVLLSQAEGYATEGYWPMNDTACGNYGGCRFRDICSASPKVRDVRLNADFKKLPPEARWNPLKSR